MNERFSLYNSLQVISKLCGQNIFSDSERSKCEKLYVFFFMFLVASIYIMTLLWRITLPISWVDNLYNLGYASLFLSNLSSLYFINLSQRTSLYKMFRNIRMLQSQFPEPGMKLYEEKKFHVYFFTIHALYFFYCICLFFVFKKVGHPVHFVFVNIIICYLVILTAFQYTCVIFIIKNVLDVLNSKVEELKTVQRKLYKTPNKDTVIDTGKQLSKGYDKVFEIADEVNDIFGMPLLAVYTVLLIHIIRCVAVSVRYKVFNWYGTEAFTIINVLGCLIWLGVAQLLSTACGEAKYALRQGSLLLYEAIIHMPFEQAEDNSVNRLILLTYSLTNRPFTFTVCGFYEVDYNLLFSMIGSIAYYVVILIQLQ